MSLLTKFLTCLGDICLYSIYICICVHIFAGGIEMIELGNFVLYIYTYCLQS